jgi:hypothetical protein
MVMSAVAALILCANSFGQAPKQDAYIWCVGVDKLSAQFAECNDAHHLADNAKDQYKFWMSMQAVLFGQAHGKVRLNEGATVATLRGDMDDMATKARPGMTFVVDLNAHGGVDELGDYEMCAYDGVVKGKEIRDWVSKLVAKGSFVIVIVESCHSGALNLNQDHVVFMCACQKEQTSLDGDPLMLHDHSLFVQAVLEGLGGKADANGDGTVTVTELVSYVKVRLGKLAAKYSHEQTPVFNFPGVAPDYPVAKVPGTPTSSVPAGR